jgi:hypothetical protein
MGDRTSIPCGTASKDRLEQFKDEKTTWDELLQDMANEYADGTGGEIHTNSSGEKSAELVEEINRLRRELDEFKHNMPEKVAEELR